MYHVNRGAAQSPPASSTPSAFAETARLRCRHVACRSPSTPSLACSYLPPRQAGEPCRDAAQGCLRCAARESRRHAGGSADERLGVQICLRRAACRSRVCVGGSGGYGYALEHASTELRSDRELVLAAVQGSGRASRRHHVVALMHASAELRADREIVLAAVRTDGWALKYVCGELQAGPRGCAGSIAVWNGAQLCLYWPKGRPRGRSCGSAAGPPCARVCLH